MKIKYYSNYYYRPQDQDPVVDYLRTARAKRPTKTKDITKTGLGGSTVNNLFNGKTRSPRFATVMVIARAIGPEAVDAVSQCLRLGGRNVRVVNGGKQKKQA